MDASNMLHSEEQLRNTLHFEDKDKLRRKLAQLQKEYVKTAQRLKRAEHLDAVRKQVKSKHFLQKHQDQRHSEITSNSSFIFNTNDVSKGLSQCQADAVDCDTSRRSQVILFSPPGDPASPQDPDASSDIAESRRSTSLRLRSRRSRLRWQKNVSALNRSDNGQQQQTQNSSTAGQQVTMKEKYVNNETKELFPVPQSESPSLLLTHFCTDKLTKTGHKTVEENQTSKEEREKTTDLNVEGKCGKSALITMREKLSAKENKLISNNIGEDSVSQIKEAKAVACAEGIHENTKQAIPQSTGNEKCVETKEEKNLITADEKAVRLLDSCTLVEGLPFPVEYYIRTTRRMTLSQSQPDMQAVILSQLSTGQHRRRRGRSRGTNEDRQQSNRHTGTDSSAWTTPSTSVIPSNVDTSKNGFQRSCDISGCVLSEAPFSPSVPNLRPPRGRKKGKGWYRPQPLKQGCDQTTGDIRPPNNSLSSRHCIRQVSSEKNSLLDLSQQSPTCSCPDQPLGSGAPASLTAEHQEKVFPIFLKNSTCRPQQMTAGTSNWQSLLLPSLPSSSSQISPLSLPTLISRLKCLDIQQDFHLPDEQFASLKLHKLRQVAMESGLEHFSTPSHNTRRRSNCLYSSMDPLNPCFLPLGFTPTITDSPCPNQNEQTSAQQTKQVTRDNLNSKWVNEELCNPNISETNVALNAKTPTTPVKCTDSQNEVFNKNGKKLFLNSPLDSVESSFSAPNLPSSPVLPSLGVTPLAPNLTFSPSTVSICLPPTENTSTQDPPPPDLLPGSPNTSNPPSLPPSSLCGRIQDLSELLATADQGDEDKPADYPGPSRIQLYSSAEKEEITEGTTEKRLPRCTHTLEAPAGGTLVDACCVLGPSGGLCVAAAGKWAVCLWSQTSEFDWSFKHTWTFSEPVINVVSVPGSAGLMIVSLGQLEIRQLSVLSSCSLRQTLMCEGIIQAVASLFNSKVVVALDSAAGSDLQVFTLSDSSSVLSSQPLVSPGVCVSTLAPVEELSDALIGTDDERHIFIWNVKTGHLLSRVQLEQSLTNTACLRGYSYCGVLLVLLQHEYISSLDQEEDKARETNRMLSEKLFSLVSINPLSGKSLLATQLFPPKGWTSRLWEVDVNRSSIMGLGQRCVCVWELRQGGTSQIMEAPEDEDWQLARWGEGETLLIGHQNGNISLYFYSLRPTQKYAKSNTKTPLL